MKIYIHDLEGKYELKERALDIEFVLENGQSLLVDFREWGNAIGVRSGREGIAISPVAGNLINVYSVKRGAIAEATRTNGAEEGRKE